MATSSSDSPRNCVTSCRREAPSTLRSATSRARCPDRAVERLTKLMQAMTRISIATIAKVATVRGSLPGVNALSWASPRCTSATLTSFRSMMSARVVVRPSSVSGGMTFFSQAGRAALIRAESAPSRSFT
jgi:hypothetical protein